MFTRLPSPELQELLRDLYGLSRQQLRILCFDGAALWAPTPVPISRLRSAVLGEPYETTVRDRRLILFHRDPCEILSEQTRPPTEWFERGPLSARCWPVVLLPVEHSAAKPSADRAVSRRGVMTVLATAASNIGSAALNAARQLAPKPVVRIFTSPIQLEDFGPYLSQTVMRLSALLATQHVVDYEALTKEYATHVRERNECDRELERWVSRAQVLREGLTAAARLDSPPHGARRPNMAPEWATLSHEFGCAIAEARRALGKRDAEVARLRQLLTNTRTSWTAYRDASIAYTALKRAGGIPVEIPPLPFAFGARAWEATPGLPVPQRFGANAPSPAEQWLREELARCPDPTPDVADRGRDL